MSNSYFDEIYQGTKAQRPERAFSHRLFSLDSLVELAMTVVLKISLK